MEKQCILMVYPGFNEVLTGTSVLTEKDGKETLTVYIEEDFKQATLQSTTELDPIQKMKYMDIGARICGFNFKKEDLDLMISIYDLNMKKGGDATLDDITSVKFAVDKRRKQRELEELNRKELELITNH